MDIDGWGSTFANGNTFFTCNTYPIPDFKIFFSAIQEIAIKKNYF